MAQWTLSVEAYGADGKFTRGAAVEGGVWSVIVTTVNDSSMLHVLFELGGQDDCWRW